MNTVSAEALATWCAEVASGFRRHEHHLQDDLRRNRDAALIEFTVRHLATGTDPTTAEIAERVSQLRTDQGNPPTPTTWTEIGAGHLAMPDTAQTRVQVAKW